MMRFVLPSLVFEPIASIMIKHWGYSEYQNSSSGRKFLMSILFREAVVTYSGHKMTHRQTNIPDVDCKERVIVGCGKLNY